MTNPVVNMLQEWRLRLSEVVPDTEEKVLQLLNLPLPAEIDSLHALGISQLKIDPSVSCVTVRFLEPLLFADVVAGFGDPTLAIARAPGNFHESPRGYRVDGQFSTSFTFYVQSKAIRNDANQLEWIGHCDRLLISLPNYTGLQVSSDAHPVPVGRFRAWWRRLRHNE
jgi:hypothetical protein